MQAELFVLDSMIFDKIIDDELALEAIHAAVGTGQIRLLKTHIQEDEHADIPDEEKRQRMAAVPTVDTATVGGFIIGVSRLDRARLGDGVALELVRNGSLRHTNDALLAATAEAEGAVLVTKERRLRNFATRELGLTVWDWVTFKAYVTSL